MNCDCVSECESNEERVYIIYVCVCACGSLCSCCCRVRDTVYLYIYALSVLCVRWQCLQSNVIYNHFHLIRFVAVAVSVAVVSIIMAVRSMYRQCGIVYIYTYTSSISTLLQKCYFISPLDFGISGFLLIITVDANGC